jgi:hypothetical protein
MEDLIPILEQDVLVSIGIIHARFNPDLSHWTWDVLIGIIPGGFNPELCHRACLSAFEWIQTVFSGNPVYPRYLTKDANAFYRD